MSAAIERYFPQNGPCLICGKALYARHRMVDAIRERRSVGETIAFIARDYRLPRAAIVAAVNAPANHSQMHWRKWRREFAEAMDRLNQLAVKGRMLRE